MGTFSYAAFFTGIRSAAFFLLILLTQTSCPDNPVETEDHPHQADCPNGFLPCESDSTICCEVICPPGTLLGGQDSTECIPVECPQYYHLCGPDSTDCCLETTSHDFIWEVDTIFTGFTNYANDVAIIDDTTIWVVGEFELDDPEDTLTSFEERFNIIKWDGNKWDLSRATLPEWLSIPRLSSIYSLNNTDTWVGGYGPMHWNGNEWQAFGPDIWPTFNNSGRCIAIWGSSSDDVFFGSVDGQINHWDGTGFERMDTPTEVQITDIWGNSADNVWSAGWSIHTGASIAIHYDGNTWETKYYYSPGDLFREDSISHQVYSMIPFDDGNISVLSLYGIYTTTLETIPTASSFTSNYWWRFPFQMRGNHKNDLYISGQSSLIAHYNGHTVMEYPIPGDYNFNGLSVMNEQVVATGTKNNVSIIVRKK
jgi:hypothetical protein